VNIVIAATQVPFVRGGAEVLVDGLAGALEQAGHRVVVVALPFRWYPPATIPAHALAWRLLDLTEANGVPIDRVICTKFPTWAVRHPHKVAWVVHQHRQAYDWYGTSLSDFANTPDDRRVRDSIRAIDARGLGECTRVYGISRNVVARLSRFNKIGGAALYPPTTLTGLVPGGPDGGFLLSVARLDAAKRLDLVFRALAACAERVELRVVSDGPERERLERLAATLRITDRIRFLGRVLDAEVLTTSESGGVLEFVQDGVNGAVVAPDAGALARVLDAWWRAPADAMRLGNVGPKAVATINWERVVRELTR